MYVLKGTLQLDLNNFQKSMNQNSERIVTPELNKTSFQIQTQREILVVVVQQKKQLRHH